MEEKLVVVMGATGCGKSRLIKLATGDSNIVIGDSLKSETHSISTYAFEVARTRITLVDTPGFDDTYRSDRDILELVSRWLTESYRSGTKVSAIVYVYRISDPRMQGSALRNFRIFRELCGEDCFAGIRLCTTFWDLFGTDLSKPEARLKELAGPEFWGEMLSKGSSMSRAPTAMQDARGFFFMATQRKKMVMQIQREVVDEEKGLDKTTAMLSFLDLELKRQREEHEKDMQEVRAQCYKEMAAKEAERNIELEAMRKEFEAKLEKQRVATAEVEQVMKRRVSEQASQKDQVQKQMEQLQLRRAQTSLDQQFRSAVLARQRRVDQFNDCVDKSMTDLRVGINNGRVKCGWKPVKQCFTLVCSHCLMSIGTKEYYGEWFLLLGRSAASISGTLHANTLDIGKS